MGGYPEEMKLMDPKPVYYEKEGDKMTFYLSRGPAKCEILSSGMAGNARSLAKLGAFMANKGQFDGTSLMSPETHTNIHSEATTATLDRGGRITSLTKAGFAQF